MPSMAVLAMVAAIGFAKGPEAPRPLILAHYLPWYVAKPHSSAWGWHWTMNAFDPDKVEAGRRSIASHYYPLVGPYDAGDASLLEYHLLLMKVAGIDGVVVDWYGRTDHLDYGLIHRNAEALHRACTALGLKFAVCYEDQIIPKLVAAGKAPAGRVDHARGDIEWLSRQWFRSPAYVRLEGRPLLLSFGQNGLTDAEWDAALPSAADGPLYLSEHRRRACAAGAFDWPVPGDHVAALDRFNAAMTKWPSFVPVAFPRFHDVYAEAKVHASYGRIPDADGKTFVETLRRALTSKAPAVQIATWNDWGEGTGIEPTREFGYRDLETVQRLRRELVDAAFSFTPADLKLPHRLHSLRGQRMPPTGVEQLDRVASRLAAGKPGEARQLLDQVEGARKVGATAPR